MLHEAARSALDERPDDEYALGVARTRAFLAGNRSIRPTVGSWDSSRLNSITKIATSMSDSVAKSTTEYPSIREKLYAR